MEANRFNDDLPSLADTITIAPGVNPVLSIAGAGEDASVTGDLDIEDALVIEGGGATIDGAGLDRVVDVVDHTATLRDLTITGGAVTGASPAGNGGGIRASGLLLERVVVRGNTAAGNGGGVAGSQTGDVAVVDSDIDGNQAGLSGGGISAPLLDVTRSLIRNNQAGGSGGGLGTLDPARARVEDSTITGNSAGAGGGAIAMSDVLQPGVVLVRSTVAANVGSPSLSVARQICTRGCFTWAAVNAEGSILVAPPGTAACDAPVVGLRFNLAPDGTCGATVPGTGQLEPLADNGGPTLTHAPVAGSGAIDALPSGTSGLCGTGLTDQRSVLRPQGTACDIGAVEQ
jgi:predicted outer membrane repeat protein